MQIAGLNQKILRRFSVNREDLISKIKNTGLYLLVPIISFSVSIFTSPLFARYLTAEEFGYFGYYNSVGSFLTPFFSLVFPAYHMSVYFKFDELERRKVLTSLALFTLLWNIIFYPLACIGMFVYMRYSHSSVPFYPFIILVFGAGAIANYKTFVQANYRLGQKAFLYFLIVTGYRVLAIFVSLYFVIHARMGLYGRIIGVFITEVLFFIISLIHIFKGQELKIQKDVIRKAFRMILPLLPATFFYLPILSYDNIVLERLRQPAEMGLYNIGKGIATYLYTALFPFYQTFEPEIYKNTVLKNIKSLKKTSFLLMVLVGISLIAFWLVSPFLINYVTAGKYNGALKYSNILAITSCLMIVYSILDAIINALHETKKSLLINAISAGLCVILYTSAAKYFAETGVAVATDITYFCLVCFQAFFVVKRFKKELPQTPLVL